MPESSTMEMVAYRYMEIAILLMEYGGNAENDGEYW